jgi:RimJ/RimL family protein N-acetyltransferase
VKPERDILQTKRLMLHPLTASDMPVAIEIANEPTARFALNNLPTAGLDHALTSDADTPVDDWEQARIQNFLVKQLSDSSGIGFVHLAWRTPGCASMTVVLKPRFRDFSYGPEAGDAVARWAFGRQFMTGPFTTRLDRLEFICRPDNHPAIRALQNMHDRGIVDEGLQPTDDLEGGLAHVFSIRREAFEQYFLASQD